MRMLETLVLYSFLIQEISKIFIIEIDNDERGVIGDFATISDIRITKAKPE